jgi:hypothetical protein
LTFAIASDGKLAGKCGEIDGNRVSQSLLQGKI